MGDRGEPPDPGQAVRCPVPGPVVCRILACGPVRCGPVSCGPVPGGPGACGAGVRGGEARHAPPAAAGGRASFRLDALPGRIGQYGADPASDGAAGHRAVYPPGLAGRGVLLVRCAHRHCRVHRGRGSAGPGAGHLRFRRRRGRRPAAGCRRDRPYPPLGSVHRRAYRQATGERITAPSPPRPGAGVFGLRTGSSGTGTAGGPSGTPESRCRSRSPRAVPPPPR